MINLEHSNKWQITRSKTLDGVDIFQDYPVAEKTALPESDNEYVGWDHFKIHTVDQKRLYSTEFGPCVGLAVRGYDEADQLSHIGLAHVWSMKKVYIDFLQTVRKVVKGRIELFIAGGMNRATSNIAEIKDSIAKEHDIQVLDDVSIKFYKPIGLIYRNTMYRGDSGITQLYFDRDFNPRIELNLDMTGLDNLEEAVADVACKMMVLPDTALGFRSLSNEPQFK